MRDLGLKLLSIFIAFALALFVRSESNTSVITFIVPIEIRNLAKDKIVLESGATQAEVTVRGPSFLVTRLYSSPPIFKVTLPDDLGSTYSATLNEADLKLPSSMRVLKIDPAEVELKLDKRISLVAAVQVKSVGNLPPGLKLEGIEPMPDRVEIQGAQSELAGVRSVETFPIDLSQVGGDEQRELTLNIPGRHSTASVSRAQVRVEVEFEALERKFAKLPVKLIAPKSMGALQSVPDVVDITVSGKTQAIKALEAKDIVISLKVDDRSQLDLPRKANVELPRDISLVVVKPETLKVVSSQASKR